jgi:MbtH protein
VNVLDDDSATFRVLINGRHQYSLWPSALPVPGGWTDTGVIGTKADCADYLREAWPDIRR